MYSCTLSLTSALGGVGGQLHAPAALTPGKTRYSLLRRRGGHEGRSGRVRKISPLQVFDPLTVQPAASSHTDPPINIVVTSNLKVVAVGSRTRW